MTVSGDLEKAADRVRDCGNYLIFARGERSGYIKVMVTARTADFQIPEIQRRCREDCRRRAGAATRRSSRSSPATW